jgi:hypothetical protein
MSDRAAFDNVNPNLDQRGNRDGNGTVTFDRDIQSAVSFLANLPALIEHKGTNDGYENDPNEPA